MAYCVHCGVKLQEGAQKCPLCGTPVFDPAASPVHTPPRNYPTRTPEQRLTYSKVYLMRLFSLLLLLPGALCLLIDFLRTGGISWSVYPAVALGLIWVSAFFPLLLRHRSLLVDFVLDTVVLSVYLWLVEKLSRSGVWFFPNDLPALLFMSAQIILIWFLFTHGRLNKLTTLAASLIAVGLECMFIEALCALRFLGTVAFSWAYYVLAPCLFIGLLLFFINGNRSIREEFRRRTHF